MFPDACAEPQAVSWFDDEEGAGGTHCPVFLAIERRAQIAGYALFEKGALPDPGGWLRQQEWWMQVFETIDGQVKTVRSERAAPAPANEE